MNGKYVMYALIPAFALALAAGGVASARGMFGGFGQSNLTPDQIAENQQTRFQNEANLLGISVDEVKNAWAAGKNMRDLAAEKGVSQDQLHTKMLELQKQQMKSQLSTLVNKGVITQAQADLRSQFIDQMSSNTSTKSGRGFGRGFGRHGMGMMHYGF
jgi:hypothetical protein